MVIFNKQPAKAKDMRNKESEEFLRGDPTNQQNTDLR